MFLEICITSLLLFIILKADYLRRCILTFNRDFRAVSYMVYSKFILKHHQNGEKRIYDLYEATINKFGPTRVACILDDIRWKYMDLKDYCDRAANVYLSLGLQQGDHIALFSETTAFYSQIWLAADKIGLATGLINYGLKKESLIHSLNEVKPRLIIASSNLAHLLEELDLDPSYKVAVFDENIETSKIEERTKQGLIRSPKMSELLGKNKDWISFDEEIAKAKSLGKFKPKRFSTADPILYIFTSGTTGFPKAAVISHSRYFIMALGINYMLKIRSSDVLYTTLPLYHTAGGLAGVGQCVLFGCKQVLRKKFSASQYWHDCVKYKCTVVQYIGEICRYLLAQPVRPEETMHNVRLGFGNGMRPQVWKEFVERFKVAQIGEIYGATESCANLVNCDNKVGAVGFGSIIAPWFYPLHLVKADLVTGELIRDSKTGFCQRVSFNQPGQLIGEVNIKAGLNFDGYLNKMASSKKIARDVFKKGDAWFMTGDLLEQDEYGYFYFKDRLGDTFRWRGENVSTNEVESIISKGIQLSDCVVYGVEVPNCEGRAGMAAIVMQDELLATMDTTKRTARFKELSASLKEYLNSALPPYAHPQFLRFVEHIEMTATFKMKKVDLVKAGFDPKVTGKDIVFYFDSMTKSYELLDEESNKKILNGQMKF